MQGQQQHLRRKVSAAPSTSDTPLSPLTSAAATQTRAAPTQPLQPPSISTCAGIAQPLLPPARRPLAPDADASAGAKMKMAAAAR